MNYKVTGDVYYHTSMDTLEKTRSGILKKGSKVNVVSSNPTKKSGIPWLKIKIKEKIYYVSGNYVKKIKTNFRKKVVDNVETCAKEIVRKKCKHVSGSYDYDGKKINCGVFFSYVYRKAGCLPKGVTVSHNGGGASHSEKLSHCKIAKVNCLYKDLPAKYKKDGYGYVTDSNICIKSGKYLYSCNKSGKTYTSLSMIKKSISSNCYDTTHKIKRVIMPQYE